jgi:hypothetical protein
MAVRSTMNTVVFNEAGDNLYLIEFVLEQTRHEQSLGA